MKKKIIAVLMMMSLLFAPASYAHSGRTDAYGGHHDYKNVSGLGDYHYHHGYGPHLHPGGVCPYESGSSTNSPSTATTAKSSGMQAEIADFSIILNGTTVNNAKLAYPILSYNYITYIPMTYNTARTLGLETEWDGSSLWIAEKGNAVFTNDVAGSNVLGQSGAVKKADFNVYINGQLLTQDSSYPFLDYKGVTYLPLTSDIANKLNLSVQWDDVTGIIVAPKTAQSAYTVATAKTTVYNGTTDQYINLLNAGVDTYNLNASNTVTLPKVANITKTTVAGGTISTCFLTPRVYFSIVTQSNGSIETVTVFVEAEYADELDAVTYYAYRDLLTTISNLDGTASDINTILMEISVVPGNDESKIKEYNGLLYAEIYDVEKDIEQFAISIPSIFY